MLVQHVTETHGEKLDVVKKKHKTTRAFLIWKENVEKETTSWFVKYRKRRCNRTGTHKPRGTGNRAMKQQGTSKIDGYCTAQVTTSKSDVLQELKSKSPGEKRTTEK
eukprot:gene9461-10448_t